MGISLSDWMFVEVEDDSYLFVIWRFMLFDGGEYVCWGSKMSVMYLLYVECRYFIYFIICLVINWLVLFFLKSDLREVMFVNGIGRDWEGIRGNVFCVFMSVRVVCGMIEMCELF